MPKLTLAKALDRAGRERAVDAARRRVAMEERRLARYRSMRLGPLTRALAAAEAALAVLDRAQPGERAWRVEAGSWRELASAVGTRTVGSAELMRIAADIGFVAFDRRVANQQLTRWRTSGRMRRVARGLYQFNAAGRVYYGIDGTLERTASPQARPVLALGVEAARRVPPGRPTRARRRAGD